MAKYKLGEICEIVSGSTPKTGIAECWDGNLKWITPAEIDDESYIITDSARKLTELGVKKTGLSSFPSGTVILSSRAPIGKVAIAGCEMYCNQGFKNLICSDRINNRYLYWFLKGNTAYLNSLGRGATFKEISKKIVSDIEINVPEISQQLAAVDALERVSEIIRLRKNQLQKLDELIKARFVEMFAGKYETVKLGNVAKTTSGGTPSRTHPEYYEKGSIPWLTSGEVNAGVITSVKNYITEAAMENSSAKMVPANSVVVAMYGATAGVTGLLRLNTTTNQAVCSILPNERFVPEYLYYAVASKKDWMISQCQGGGQSNISQGIIRSMEIIDAPLELQNRFAAFVAEVDKSKLAIQQSLDKLKTLRKSLMQEYYGQGE